MFHFFSTSLVIFWKKKYQKEPFPRSIRMVTLSSCTPVDLVNSPLPRSWLLINVKRLELMMNSRLLIEIDDAIPTIWKTPLHDTDIGKYLLTHSLLSIDRLVCPPVLNGGRLIGSVDNCFVIFLKLLHEYPSEHMFCCIECLLWLQYFVRHLSMRVGLFLYIYILVLSVVWLGKQFNSNLQNQYQSWFVCRLFCQFIPPLSEQWPHSTQLVRTRLR